MTDHLEGVVIKVVDHTDNILSHNHIDGIRIKSPGTVDCYIDDEEATKSVLKRDGSTPQMWER